MMYSLWTWMQVIQDMGIYSPLDNFATVHVFWNAKSILTNHGVFVMNVVPLCQESYSALLLQLKAVFEKVYEIEVENEKNKVLAATLLPPPASCDHVNKVSDNLRKVISADEIGSPKRRFHSLKEINLTAAIATYLTNKFGTWDMTEQDETKLTVPRLAQHGTDRNSLSHVWCDMGQDRK
ncbi:hypothetical protein OSB04_021531 [Centaurea solstitialis]|uniref:Uncharacterized protein n=1 Tax=Centaurea solstitialis TaxID=347529 RepID=A0AA38T227_9ASTR|nr:hypothetical protein OSB04_021531 [Centaurea solstitialis]